jgi:hypothetical protein
LLDWLASEFVESGWSIKHMQRLIVLSATWRQVSAPRPDGLHKDAGSRLLWRFPPRRLDAEAIRDQMLSVTGVLDLRMGGPGYSAFAPNFNYVRVYDPKQEYGPAEWRRMVYQTKVRMAQDSTFGAFDCPDAGQSSPKRSRSTTPLQALNLFNSGFVTQQAGIFAARLQREAGDDVPGQVRRAIPVGLQSRAGRRGMPRLRNARPRARSPDILQGAPELERIPFHPMIQHSLTNAGRRLMNRRSFLEHAGTGLAGIALASLLSDQRLLAAVARSPIRPDIRPENPLAARPPHFAPKAKRVLVIFCSGACSQLESWDWKPELARMDGKPMPGAAENFLTFQGQNGNLVRPLV